MWSRYVDEQHSAATYFRKLTRICTERKSELGKYANNKLFEIKYVFQVVWKLLAINCSKHI